MSVPVEIRPAPQQPPLKEYKHLSEKERMTGGYPYKPLDSELTKRLLARQLLRQFNEAPIQDEIFRKEILKKLLNPNSHATVFIEPGFTCDYGYNIRIGEGCQLSYNCCLLDCGPITIGKRVLIAPGVHIYSATHPLDPIERREFELTRRVKIGDDCWLGGQVIICPGVTIGNGVTVGAGSVVNKDVPSNVVVAGNPAKVIRYLPGYNSK